MLPEIPAAFFINDMNNKMQMLAAAVIERFQAQQGCRCFTVAVSGIDASGKGYISSRLQQLLTMHGLNVALVNIDPWQNPLPVRLKKDNAALNFYENVFRWDELFEQLIFPLQRDKTINLHTNGISTHADEYYPLAYDFKHVDILLLEGIFLLKKQYLIHYDLTAWIDCSFETGLQRALDRNAEKLGEVNLVNDYQTIYYPAQQHHFQKDGPKQNADLIIDNNQAKSVIF
jgi:uridine kinase